MNILKKIEPRNNFSPVCSATQEDELGQLYLSNIDFLKNGVPASIIATLVRYLSNLARNLNLTIGIFHVFRLLRRSDSY